MTAMLYVTERSSYDTFHYDTLTLREFTVYGCKHSIAF